MYLNQEVEMVGTGNNILTAEYEYGRIKDFEKRVLTEGACRSFLPMSFIKIGDRERVNYDCSGYIAIAALEIKNSMDMVNILEKCVFSIIDACGYLVNPKKIELNIGTAYYSKSKNEVRLAYVPRRTPVEKTMDVFMGFLDNMENCTKSKEMTAYLRVIKSYIEYSGCGLFDVVNYIGELKQEIHACGFE